jgi:alcohol dehydrogenase class IV
LILKNSEELKQNLLDLEVRNNLLIAANKAGLAFSNTKTGAAHSISYPLTAYFNIPHGIASSFALIPLLEINGPLISNDLDKILETLGLGSVVEMISIIKAIPNNNIKYNLRNWGLKESDLDFIAEQSFTKGRMDNNIVDLTKSDVRKILETIY